MRKLIITIAVLAVVAASGGAYHNYRKAAPPPDVTTARVLKGDLVDTVGATGTLQAVTTVQVGTQVSGTISELNADFNSLVRKGQVLARLDPSLFQTQIEQARANLVRAEADVERLRVNLDDARTKLKRAQELSARNLIPQTELETAQVNVRSAEAQIRSSQAQVTQAQAALNQNQVNLEHTVIAAPIDGIVISRNVDVGQTVAASMQAPTLFVLAADLAKMQVVASLDESDVGRIRPGQAVRFRVDAYPAEDFTGTVSQVRLQPQVVQNVVTYSTVIEVPNPDLKLKPGMTANVNIEIARRNNAIRVPNAALRFRPTDEMYAALGQTPPAPAEAARAQGASSPASGSASSKPPPQAGAPPRQPRTAAPAPRSSANEGRSAAGPAPEGRQAQALDDEGGFGRGGFGRGGGGFRGGGGGGADSGGRAQFMERLQSLPPEERERMLQRMRGRGFDPTAGAAADNAVRPQGARPGTPAQGPSARNQSLTARNPKATTIDALFGPLPPVESVGRVWIYVNKQLKPVRVRLGISDGQATELIEGDLQPGTELVTNVSTGAQTRPPIGGIGNPFGQPGRGGFPGGGFPGGGGGGRPAGGGSGGQAPRR